MVTAARHALPRGHTEAVIGFVEATLLNYDRLKRLMAGEIGSVSIDGESFSADLNGAAVALQGPVCPATSAECRA